MIVATRTPKKSHEYRFYSLCHGGGKMTTEQPAVKQEKRERGRGRIFVRKGSAFLRRAYYLRGREHRQSTD
jgi:hypothetical protein